MKGHIGGLLLLAMLQNKPACDGVLTVARPFRLAAGENPKIKVPLCL
jgi:hypothetical protein